MQKPHPVLTEGDINKVLDFLKSGRPLSGFKGSEREGGENVQALENAFREYFKVEYAVAFNSATAALYAACVACDVREGIVTPFSFVASASCVRLNNGTEVFADINEDTFCLSPQSVADHVTKYTDAIIPVHLMGNVCDMDEIMKIAKRNDLYVIEDAAQAIGAEYKGRKAGTIGDCGIFSFNQSKPISSGEGGMLITNNNFIYRMACGIRNHGEFSEKYYTPGFNFRMCEIEAILALEQFKRLDENNNHRIELCNFMTKELRKLPRFTPPLVRDNIKHTYYTYGIKYEGDKYELCKRLQDRGVYFGTYIKPLYNLPIFGGGRLPVVERVSESLLVSDVFRDELTLDDCKDILKIIEECDENLATDADKDLRYKRERV